MNHTLENLNKGIKEREELLTELSELKEETFKKMKQREWVLLYLNFAAILSNTLSFLTTVRTGLHQNYWFSGLGLGLCIFSISMYFLIRSQRKNTVKKIESKIKSVEESIEKLKVLIKWKCETSH